MRGVFVGVVLAEDIAESLSEEAERSSEALRGTGLEVEGEGGMMMLGRRRGPGGRVVVGRGGVVFELGLASGMANVDVVVGI